MLPLPWQLWPAEARLLMGLAGFWSVAGLVVLASASWWVALREMGDGGFYLKRQPIHSPGPDQRSQRRRLVEIVMPSKLQLAISQMACRLR